MDSVFITELCVMDHTIRRQIYITHKSCMHVEHTGFLVTWEIREGEKQNNKKISKKISCDEFSASDNNLLYSLTVTPHISIYQINKKPGIIMH